MSKGLYGDISVSQRENHTYLRMQLEYTRDGNCVVKMRDYIEDIINLFPEVIM